ncbi:hypothetical protein DFH29DRAFT_1082334 [Suillus ampliporus]|nr:hypothetical protein DFH29DRAFT_1082334 [Suillus ampliporus]
MQMQPHLHSLASGSSSLEQIVQLSSATVIILERSFHIWDQRRNLTDWQMTSVSVRDAVEQYMMPPHAAAVRKAVGTAVHIYEAQLSTGKAKLSFKVKLPFSLKLRRASEGSERKAELINTILQLTLEHRLRPDPRKRSTMVMVFGVEPRCLGMQVS